MDFTQLLPRLSVAVWYVWPKNSMLHYDMWSPDYYCVKLKMWDKICSTTIQVGKLRKLNFVQPLADVWDNKSTWPSPDVDFQIRKKSWYFVYFNQCQGHTQSRTSKVPKGFENCAKIEFFTENVKKLDDVELRFFYSPVFKPL